MLVAAAGLAVALGGCGSAASTFDPVASAAVVSTRFPGYQIQFVMRVSSPALPAPVTGAGNGTFDTTHRTGQVGIDMDFSSSPQVVQALGTSTLHLDELIDGATLYMRLPAAITSKSRNLHTPWFKVNLEQAASAAGIPGFSSLLNNPASSNPGQMLGYLRAASRRVTQLGTRTIGGVQADGYRASVDLDRVPDVYPPAARPQLRTTIAALERVSGVHALPMDVWIDGQDRVRRISFSEHQKLSTGQPMTVQMTMTFTHYGPGPAPALPPKSQVTDLTGVVAAHMHH